MNVRYTLPVFLTVLTLGGCAHLNPMHWFDDAPPADPPATLLTIQPAINVNVAWHADFNDKRPSNFSPAAVLDGIYAADTKNKLIRLDPKTGHVVWQIATDIQLSAAVGVSAVDTYVGSNKGELLAYQLDGKLHWRAQLASEVIGVPKEADNIVVARCVNGDIYGLDATTGTQKWRYQHTLPALTLHAQPSVVIYHGGVFAGFAGGKLVALSLDSGIADWEIDVSVPRGASEIERVNDVTSTPVVDDHEVCAVNYNGHLGCFDVHSGNQLWNKDISSTAGLTMDDDTIYVTDTDGSVYAYEKDHGVNRWKQSALHLRQITAPRRIGDYLAVGDYQGYVHFMSLTDGHFVARVPTDGSAITTQPLDYRDGLVVQTAKGGVYLLTLQH